MKKLTLGGGCFFLIFWWRLFWGGQIPFDGDTLLYYVPNWSIGNILWSDHKNLLWDPFRNFGQPFLASPQNQALYPIRWLGFLFHMSYLNYYRMYVTFHVALAAVSGFLLLKEIYSRNIWAALVGFVGFGFAGVINVRLPLPVDFATIAWVPLLLFFLERKFIVGLGVGMTFQFFAGYPPLFIVSNLTLLAYVVTRDEKGLRLKTILMAFLIFLGLSCVLWFPFLEVLKLSARALFLDANQAFVGSTYFKELVLGFFGPVSFRFFTPSNLHCEPVFIWVRCFWFFLCFLR